MRSLVGEFARKRVTKICVPYFQTRITGYRLQVTGTLLLDQVGRIWRGAGFGKPTRRQWDLVFDPSLCCQDKLILLVLFEAARVGSLAHGALVTPIAGTLVLLGGGPCTTS